MSEDRAWNELIEGIRAGDDDACWRFWDEYGPMIQRLAERNLGGGLQQRVDADDVVQSACRTFFRRAQGGEFELPDARALWTLLCTITLNKVRQSKRFHLAQKRGANREQPLAAGDESGAAWQPAAAGPTPAEQAAFSEQLEHIVSTLTAEERRVLDLKLQQLSNQEIKEELGRSERTVGRLLQRVRDRLEEMLAD